MLDFSNWHANIAAAILFPITRTNQFDENDWFVLSNVVRSILSTSKTDCCALMLNFGCMGTKAER